MNLSDEESWSKKRSSSEIVESNILILPISTENEGSKTGTASVLNEFCADFGITQTKDERYLKYDNVNIKFDLKNARERHIFLTELKHHHEQQRLLLENIEQSEKQSSGHSKTASFCDAFEQLLNEELVVPEEESERHLQGIRSKWTQKDTEFNDMLKELIERVNSAITEQDLQVLASYLKKNIEVDGNPNVTDMVVR